MATMTQTVPDMAKHRPKSSNPAKRQQEFLVLPPEYLVALRDSKAETGQNMTLSGQIALELYFRAIGKPFKENWPSMVNKLLAELTKAG
jgi:hypothetical protein